MRSAALVVVIGFGSAAYADGGARFDAGLIHSQVAITDQTAISGSLARFGVGFATSKHVHIGAEVEEGWMTGNVLPGAVVARTGIPEGPLSANTLDLKLLAGLHTDAGPFRISGDIGAGLRDTSVSTDAGMDIAGRKKEPLLELRACVDVFVSRAWTVGVVAGADTLERRDISIGAVLGLQLDR